MIEIKSYDAVYEQSIQALFSIPVSGDMVLSLERSPSYLTGAYIQTETPRIFLCVHTGNDQVVGIFNIGLRRIIFEQKIKEVPYFCDLRIHPDFQNGTLLLKIIRQINTHCKDLDQIPAITVVFADNHKMTSMIARRLVSSQKSDTPYYHEVAEIETHVFRSINSKKHPYHIRIANENDLDAMMSLQKQVNDQKYTPYYDLYKIKESPYYQRLSISDFYLAFEGDSLCGFCGIWDLSSIKQTRVLAYHGWMKHFRTVYNYVLPHFFNFPILPKPGDQLNTCSIHAISIQGRNPVIFRTLLHQICEDIVGKSDISLLCTLDVKDPLNAVFDSKINKVSKAGKVYLINNDSTLDPKFQQSFFVVDAPRI
ncbi:MAG TPA: hypothetical protein PLY70_09565 [Saprospiraceae bacterium]|nr:hypothetical protein [Saprospiraceae bacterium]HPN72185.1 hypothetical protein [Saprospiraceae bacterium]